MTVLTRRGALIGGVSALTAVSSGVRAQAGPVSIGVIYSMTGATAQVGVDARHAFETALDIINSEHDLNLPLARTRGLPGVGGQPVRLIYADHQGDPQKGRAEAERLITQEKVCALLGCYHSSVSSTVSVVAERYGIPFVCADSTSPSLHRRGLKFFFRPGAHDEMFSEAMFNFLDDLRSGGKKADSVALFFDDTLWGIDSSNVQRKLATERGYKIAADIKYRNNSPSLTAEVQQLKAGNADVLLPSSYTTDAILLVKTMGELGYQPKNILAQGSGFSEQVVYNAVGDKLFGAITRASFSLDLANARPAIAPVNAKFRARANYDLSDNTSRQFTGLLIIADAINRAQSTEGVKVRDALAATQMPAEMTIMPWKRVSFGSDGQNPDAEPVLLQYADRKFVTIFPKEVAAGSTVWPRA